LADGSRPPDQVEPFLQPLPSASRPTLSRGKRQAGRDHPESSALRLPPEEEIIEVQDAVREAEVIDRKCRQPFQVMAEIVSEVSDSADRETPIDRPGLSVFLERAIELPERVPGDPSRLSMRGQRDLVCFGGDGEERVVSDARGAPTTDRVRVRIQEGRSRPSRDEVEEVGQERRMWHLLDEKVRRELGLGGGRDARR
jgi:hypothetical protein